MSPVPFTFAAIDFETTGSVEGFAVEPWQIGVAVFSPGVEPVVWESLLRIGPRPFHPHAPGKHARIRNELEQAPTLEMCLGKLRTLLTGRPLVAHNISTERNVLSKALPMEIFGPWIDTLKLSRAAWPDLISHKLEGVLDQLALDQRLRNRFPGRAYHDALFDAYGSALILEFLLEKPEWREVSLNLLRHPDQSAYRR